MQGNEKRELFYHEPYRRLARRKAFERVYSELATPRTFISVDSFAFFDAVAKRGGYMEVCKGNKWEAVNLSLPYYSKLQIQRKYLDGLFPMESKLMAAFPDYCEEALKLANCNFVETYSLAIKNVSYDVLSFVEKAFGNNVCSSNTDEYFNLKCLAIGEHEKARIPVEYADKFCAIRKWLMFHAQTEPEGPNEFQSLRLNTNTSEVLIAGYSLASLMMADTLSDFGVKVTVLMGHVNDVRNVENVRKAEESVFSLESFEYDNLLRGRVQCQKISSKRLCYVTEDGRIVSQEQIASCRATLLSVFEEIKNDTGNRSDFIEYMIFKTAQKINSSTGSESEKILTKWQLDRYLSLVKLKGDSTTVADFVTFYNHRGAKESRNPLVEATLRDTSELSKKIAEKGRAVTFVKDSLRKAQYKGGKWSVRYSNDSSQTKAFDYLIYADSTNLSSIIAEGKMAEYFDESMGDRLKVLDNLLPVRYANCLFQFKQKVVFKEGLDQFENFTVKTPNGIVNFIVLKDGLEVLSIMKCRLYSNPKYEAQAYALLDSKLFSRSTKQVLENCTVGFEYSFGLKDDKCILSLMKMHQTNHLFFHLPITTNTNPYRLSSVLDIGVFITGSILMSVHGLRNKDPQIRNLFMKSKAVQSPRIENEVSKIMKTKQQEQIWQSKKEKSIDDIEQKQQRCVIEQPVPIKNNLERRKEVNREMKQVEKEVNAPQAKRDSHPASADLPKDLSRLEVEAFGTLQQLSEDAFGEKNRMVLAYLNVLKGKLDIGAPWGQILKVQRMFEISRPEITQNGLQLCSLGQPLIITDQEGKVSKVVPLRNMISRRKFFSLEGTESTVYFQCIVAIREQIFFVMADELSPDNLFYHTSQKRLCQLLNLQLIKRKGNQIISEGKSERKIFSRLNLVDTLQRNSIGSSSPVSLLPFAVQQRIAKELKEQSGLSLDEVLMRKLCRARQSMRKEQSICNADTLRSHAKSTIRLVAAQTPLLKTYNQESRLTLATDAVLDQIRFYLQEMQTIFALKPITLGDIFIGKTNSSWLAYEILKTEAGPLMSISELKAINLPLGEEVERALSRKLSDHECSSLIAGEDNFIACYRNFLSGEQCGGETERYTYINNLSNNSHILVGSDGPVHFDDIESLTEQLVRRLLRRHSHLVVLQWLHKLIGLEMFKIEGMTGQLKFYFNITRGKSLWSDQQDPLPEKYRNLPEQDLRFIQEQRTNETLNFIDGDFVFIVA